jgi:hypothetical protein
MAMTRFGDCRGVFDSLVERLRRSRLVSWISAIRNPRSPSAQRKGYSWLAWLRRRWSLAALSVMRLTAVPHKAATAFMLACGIRTSTSEPAHETVVICLGEMVPDATGECRELSAS